MAPKKLLVLLGGSIFAPLLLELGFRMLESTLGVDEKGLESTRALICDGNLGKYAPHPYTSFVRTNNSFGFIDPEWKVERTSGVPRILCMGGSTTEGGNSRGRVGAYPYLLEQGLEKRCGRDFEVFNAGMSFWTSAELLVAWFLILQDLQPDVLVIHSGINDCAPRVWPGYRPDYRHYRRSLCPPCFSPQRRFLTRWSDLYAWLQLSSNTVDIAELASYPLRGPTEFARTGKLDPATAHSFRRNIESICDSAQAHGVRVLLMTVPLQPETEETLRTSGHYFAGVAEHNVILRELAREKGWLLADAARIDELDRERRTSLFVSIAHVTPEGNQMKADYILGALAEDWPPQLGSYPGR